MKRTKSGGGGEDGGGPEASAEDGLRETRQRSVDEDAGGKIDDSDLVLAEVPADELICKLSEMASDTASPKPGSQPPPLSFDVEGAARSLLPADVPPLYPRAWISTERPLSERSKEGVQLRFVQFNVLADGLSGEDALKGGFYAAPPPSLDWRFRRINLVREIFRQGARPDIIAMEEVDHYYDWFEPMLRQLGYRGHYAAKPNSPCKKVSPHSGLEDGCALFWRSDTVTMTQVESLNYNAYTPEGRPTGSKSNQVAILATLRVKGATPIVAAVTHLAAAKTAEGERVRAQQMQELLRALARRERPCIVGLDMNATPDSHTYAAQAYPLAISKNVTTGEGKDPLRSAYAEVMGAEPRWTTWKKRSGNGKTGEVSHTIDYILISKQIECTRVLAPPADVDVVPERLPGWSYPSDHVALLAELVIPEKTQAGDSGGGKGGVG